MTSLQFVRCHSYVITSATRQIFNVSHPGYVQRRLATRHQCVGRVHVTTQAGRVYINNSNMNNLN